MELKKSYKGLIAWIIGFFAAYVMIAFWPAEDGALITRVSLNIATIGITVLAYIVYETEHVYWYNGTTYEQAVEAGSERRREFAMRHLKRFALFAIEFLIFSVIAYLLDLHVMADVLVMCVGLLAVAISTIPIKL